MTLEAILEIDAISGSSALLSKAHMWWLSRAALQRPAPSIQPSLLAICATSLHKPCRSVTAHCITEQAIPKANSVLEASHVLRVEAFRGEYSNCHLELAKYGDVEDLSLQNCATATGLIKSLKSSTEGTAHIVFQERYAKQQHDMGRACHPQVS